MSQTRSNFLSRLRLGNWLGLDSDSVTSIRPFVTRFRLIVIWHIVDFCRDSDSRMTSNLLIHWLTYRLIDWLICFCLPYSFPYGLDIFYTLKFIQLWAGGWGIKNNLVCVMTCACLSSCSLAIRRRRSPCLTNCPGPWWRATSGSTRAPGTITAASVWGPRS